MPIASAGHVAVLNPTNYKCVVWNGFPKSSHNFISVGICISDIHMTQRLQQCTPLRVKPLKLSLHLYANS